MRAVRCTGSGVTVVDVPLPGGEGVRVQVTHAGICGSDLAMIAAGTFPPDLTIGHELAGRLPDGTPVAIEPLVPCGVCPTCRAGHYNVCEKGDEICLGLESRDGGMADEVLVPERCLVPVPEGLSLENACLVEPIAVGLHGLRRAGLRSGERVVVLGGGSIGLLAAATARSLGCEVAVVARHPHQERMAMALGASPLDGKYDLVVVAAAGPDAVEAATKLARRGGRLVLLALIEGSVLDGSAALSEISAITSMGYAGNGRREIDEAADLLGEQPEIADVITHRFPLDRASEAFQVAGDRKAGSIKVVLEP